MSDTIWISTALGSSVNIKPFITSFSESDQEHDAIDWGKQNKAGIPLPAQCFPAEIYGDRSAQESNYRRLPDLFFAATVWVVSKAAANVLRQFDLGAGSLYTVKLLKKDRQTLVDSELFCINFGNRKEALLPSESVPMYDTYVYGGKKALQPRGATKDNDIAVRQVVNTGPDIWIDPLLAFSFFVSDDLGKALQKAKAAKGFFLSKCRVV